MKSLTFTGVRLSIRLILGLFGCLILISNAWSTPPPCDKTPTGVESEDYYLDFKVPKDLMPDPAFDKRKASIRIHRIKPVYEHGKCLSVSNHAAVLIHGRATPGSVAFDLRHPTEDDPEGGSISIQEAMARSGIDTFAPDLLGFGLSSRFEDGLDDPCNASLPAFNTDGTCSLKENDDGTCSPDTTGGSEECCDKTRNAGVFPLNQQARFLGDGVLPNPTTTDGLGVNPLEGVKCAHSSRIYFANPDVWSRDILQVIDSAIHKAKPKDHKVTLLGYSFGAPTTARTLYLLGDKAPRQVNRVVFLSALYNRLPNVPTDINMPTEEWQLSETELSTTFPFNVSRLGGWTGVPTTPPGRDAFCSGRVIPDTPLEIAEQLMNLDPDQPDLGAEWGGSDPENPTGLLRSPTFTLYGFNSEVTATFTLPTLVLHGADDITAPTLNADNLFNSLTSVSSKVLVKVECGSHQMQQEGCSGNRCDDGDPATTPYGKVCDPEDPDSCTWDGPHSTVAAALIEWIKEGTFDGAECGQFNVNPSGIASEVATPNCP